MIKLLHTADWHLGKRLDHVSRLEEQRAVLEEICEIAEREAVHMVIVAGDLFDQINPPTEAIDLLYKTLRRLTDHGRRPVIAIAGNHDSPDRIEAPDPLARACGIIFAGYPGSVLQPFGLETGLEVTHTAPGYLRLQIPGVEVPVSVLLTPYANEIRLRQFLGNENPDQALRTLLGAQWAHLAATADPAGITLLAAHLCMMAPGGEVPVEPEDEKPILTIGGLREIYPDIIPPGVQYTALGHLHRCHQVGTGAVWYSGSPLAYSMSEAGQAKYVLIATLTPGQPAEVERVRLTAGKPLIRVTCQGVAAATEWLREHPDAWVELTLETDTYLSAQDRRQLYEIHSGIITIIPRVTDPETIVQENPSIDLSQDMETLFKAYFQHKQGQLPDDPLMDLFREMLSQESAS